MSGSLKWKLLAGFALVFLAGFAAGAYFGAVQSRHHRFDFHHHHSATERVREHMQKRLDLTPEQIKTTAPILDQLVLQLDAIRAETGRRVHATFIAAGRELAPQLTPKQRAKLKAFEADHPRDQKKRP